MHANEQFVNSEKYCGLWLVLRSEVVCCSWKKASRLCKFPACCAYL